MRGERMLHEPERGRDHEQRDRRRTHDLSDNRHRDDRERR